MDLESALQVMWDRARRTSQRRIAKEIGVHPSALTRWKKGERPDGELRELLFAWIDRVTEPAPEPAPAVPGAAVGEVIPVAIVIEARRQLAETHRDLSRIYGYAESIADLADQVSLKQRGLLELLKPWVGTETDVRAGKVAGVLSELARMEAEGEETPLAPGPITPSASADAPTGAGKRKRKSAG